MKYLIHIARPMLATTILAVAGCGGGGGGGGGGGSPGDSGMGATPSPPIAQPPAAPIVTDFTAFMRDLMSSATTNDIDEPVELESIEWVFADDDNETAYDDIITASQL